MYLGTCTWVPVPPYCTGTLRNAAAISECVLDANFNPFGRTVTPLTVGVSYALSHRSTPAHDQDEWARPSYSSTRRLLARYRPRAATQGQALATGPPA